jgi:hypothetical protein
MTPADFQAGQVLSAGSLNAIKAELARLGKLTAAPPLFVSADAAGVYFEFDDGSDAFPIKVTSGGTGGKYAWTEQVPAASGTWTAGTRSGTTTSDPAWEVNMNTAVPANTIILHAYRVPETGDVRFERGAC